MVITLGGAGSTVSDGGFGSFWDKLAREKVAVCFSVAWKTSSLSHLVRAPAAFQRACY